MRSTRILLTAVAATALAGPAVAQPGAAYPDLVPSVRPVGAQESFGTTRTQPFATTRSTVRPAAAVDALEGMTAPGGQYAAPPADPVGTLTGVPAPTLPVGSYPSPYYVDGPGCCGPLGAHGRIGYDVYTYTGVNMVFGGGLPERLNAGWTVGGGIRTLFFDQTHTAAWVLDYGLSYTHNWGQGDRDGLNLDLRQGGVFRTAFSGIREVHRTAFNFSIGRDVWLMGFGATGSLQPGETACRVGGWVGGRYGTSHVDINPLDEVDGYARRQNVFHGVTVGAHTTVDRAMGGWILFGGLRAEYGYDWTNLIPPYQGNIHNVNIQLTLGVRY